MMIKRILIILFVLAVVFTSASNFAFAAKGKKLSKAEIAEIDENLDYLTKKIYASSLFSPEDNEKLIDIKLKLDIAISSGAKPELAPMFYRAGYLYKKREMEEPAIECFQLVLENFSDSNYALKATRELKKLGVKIEKPTSSEKE